MTTLAITVVGRDRPGIIARVAEALSDAGMNLEDSSMTRLRGHFAMTLVCTGGEGEAAVAARLAELATDELAITVAEVTDGGEAEPVAQTCLVTVHGADRLGIVARLATVIAAAGGNITDLSTRLAGALYVVAAEVDLPPGLDLDALRLDVERVAAELGVDAHVRPVERDEL